MSDNYETHLKIQRLAFKSGYPRGFRCYGGYSPHHSFELMRGKCFWCRWDIQDVLAAMEAQP